MSKTPLAQASHKAAVQQSYRFDFGSDDIIYSVSFKGSVQKTELQVILESARKTSFEKSSRVIQSYMDSHNLNYSGFSVHEKLTGDKIPVSFADRLLYDSSCSVIEQCIGNTAVYCGVMDYQHESKYGYEGCYYAVAKMPSEQNSLPEYHAIIQTYSHSVSGGHEQSHFAIRRSDSRQQLITLDEEDGFPVIATFGCVDMMSLLINIADITTKQQAAGFANIS